MQEFGKEQKIVLGMVGLPARGKTYMARKINRYLNWLGYRSRVYNIGNYRREICGTDCNNNFFDPNNKQVCFIYPPLFDQLSLGSRTAQRVC